MFKHTFSKEERLCSIRHIQSLFHNGSSFVMYPYRIVYQIVDEQTASPHAQVLISVSKRRFKHAVMRNRLKRLMREAYRLEKSSHLTDYIQSGSRQLRIAVQYIGKEELALDELRSRMVKVFQKLRYAYDQVDLDVHH